MRQQVEAVTRSNPIAIAVVAIVAGAYGLDSALLWGGSGERPSPMIAEARAVVCWVLRHRMSWTLPEVGKALFIDNSTVFHACARTAEKLAISESAEGYQKLSPSFHLAIRALTLEGVQSLLPDIPTLRTMAAQSIAKGCSPSPLTNPSDQNQGSVQIPDPDSSLPSSDQRPVSKRARGPKLRLRNVPETWQPTDKHRALAVEVGANFEQQLELFRDHEFKDPKSNFDAAFRTWLRRSVEFAPRKLNGTPPGLEQHNVHKQAAGAELARKLLLGGRRP